MNRTFLPVGLAGLALVGALAGCGGGNTTPSSVGSAVGGAASNAASAASNAAGAASSVASNAAGAASSVASNAAGSASSAASGASSAAGGVASSARAVTGVDGEVEADDQSSDGRSVSIQQVKIEGAPQGWIAIHADNNGQPGQVVGQAPVRGDQKNVKVQFNTPLKSGKYHAMLHVDQGQVGTYEFPGADQPVVDGPLGPVMKDFDVTVR